MNFSFLNPWFLLGALAVAAPIWLHLRRKTETNLLRFSTLRFLDEAPQPGSSPLRLQDILLFALRVLAVLLLAGAFAWPYLKGRQQAIIRESRVYILDNTLSHQAGAGFARDRDRIVSEIGGAGPEIQTAVVELTSQPRLVVAFADPREEAVEKLKALSPSFQRGSYLAAFRQANALLENSFGERKRIILCGDNQQNQWLENANTPPFLRRVEVEAPKPAAPFAPNVALAEPRLQRIFLGEKSLVNFTVKLLHRGDARAARVTLRANDQTVLSRSLDLAPAQAAVLVQAQWEADPAVWLRGEAAVEAEPDVLPGDNRVFFSLPPVREGRVALLALSPYLRVALSPDVMRGHWVARALDPTRLPQELAANQDEEVLVVESAYLQSADARKLVWRYLTNGRGVLLLVNRVTPAISGALRELGFEAQAVSASDPPRSERFQYVFSNHAIFHPFLSPDYGNLLEVTVGRHPRLKAMQAMPLIFSESGEALFFQGTQFPGALFVAAFGLEREQTGWQTHITFIPFLDLCLQNARPADTTPLDYEPGAMSVVTLPADATARTVVLHDGPRELQRVPVAQGRAQVRLPDQPGLYALGFEGATNLDKIFSVNPPPKESDLAYVESPEALKLWRLGQDATAAGPDPAAAVAVLSLAAILRQEIWWWLLMVALAGLLIEGVWTAMRKQVP